MEKDMNVTIRTFQSGCGDCIFLILKDESTQETYHIMIDCGDFTAEIKDFIKSCLGLKIDMLIVSHYDNDHVCGLIEILNDVEMRNLRIEKIIYNCFQDYDINKAASIPDEDKDILDRQEVNIRPIRGIAETKIGASQAGLLCLLIKSNHEWYQAWDKKIFVEGDTICLGDDSKWGIFHVLSPSNKALSALKYDFIKEYTKIVKELPPEQAFENQEKYWEMLLRIASAKPSLKKKIPISSSFITKQFLQNKALTDPDESNVTVPNKASLALIWEYNGRKLLLGGDAVASQLYKAIRDLYQEDCVLFEAIKIPHHGSKNNMSNELSLLIDSEHYFLTGGKKGEGPNYETLAKIILHPLREGVHLHTIHYNRDLNLIELKALIREENNNLLTELNAKISRENEYTFEC